MKTLSIFAFLFVATMAMATVKLTTPSVGFNGYYRVNTLVPVAVLVQNVGDEVRGELHLATPSSSPSTYARNSSNPSVLSATYSWS